MNRSAITFKCVKSFVEDFGVAYTELVVTKFIKSHPQYQSLLESGDVFEYESSLIVNSKLFLAFYEELVDNGVPKDQYFTTEELLDFLEIDKHYLYALLSQLKIVRICLKEGAMIYDPDCVAIEDGEPKFHADLIDDLTELMNP